MPEYVWTNYFAQALNMLATVLLMRWLRPEQMGLWQTALLVDTYSMALRLGIINGLNREFPRLMGASKDNEARQHADTALAYTCAIGACAAIGLITAACVWPGSREWRMSLLTLGFYTPCSLYSSFNEATFRGSQTFTVLGRLLALNSVIGALLLFLVAQYGYAGHCARIAVVATSYAVLTHILRPIKLRPRFSRDTFLSLLRVGVPLYIQNYVSRVSLTVGPVLLLWMGGPTAVGLFAPVNAVLSLLALLPNSLVTFILPQQNYEYGRDGSPALVVRRLTRITAALILAAVPFALVGIPMLPWVVRTFTPQYIPSTGAMQVALLIGVARIFNVATTAYSTLSAWKEMFTNQLVLSAGQIAGAVTGAVVMPDRPWLGVAAGLLFGYILYIPVTLLNLHRIAARNSRPSEA